jgi:hypothetical protein
VTRQLSLYVSDSPQRLWFDIFIFPMARRQTFPDRRKEGFQAYWGTVLLGLHLAVDSAERILREMLKTDCLRAFIQSQRNIERLNTTKVRFQVYDIRTHVIRDTDTNGNAAGPGNLRFQNPTNNQPAAAF